MTNELVEVLATACEQEDIEVKVYDSYSGRRMIVTNASLTEVLSAVIANATLFVDKDIFVDMFIAESINVDSLGLDIILY